VTFELGKEEKYGERATVEAQITSIDLGRVVTGAMNDLMAIAFAEAFSENNDPEKEKKQEAAVEQYFINAINDPNAPKTTTYVKINLVKTNDGWKISKDNNDELISALIGNVDKMSDLFGSEN